MTESNSTAPVRTRKPKKPAKPHKAFPLTAHPSGRWCKKVKGQMAYFGPWEKPDTALALWLEQKDALVSGRRQRDIVSDAKSGAPTLAELINTFLTTKATYLSRAGCLVIQKKKGLPASMREFLARGASAEREAGDLSPHTWNSYYDVCQEIIEAFGRGCLLANLGPPDFERLRTKWAAKWGPVRLSAEINRARVVFNFAFKNRIIPGPIWFGEGFKRPSKKTIRLNRSEQGPKMFEADELRRMIDASQQPMKAMLILAINAGLGNNDIGQLPLTAIDLNSGWLNYPRPKTGMSRRCPLWSETVAALHECIAQRPGPKTDADAALVFLTFRGNGWTKDLKDRPITKETRKLLDKLGINGNRNFYCVRHTFETIGGESRDQVAVNAIMGHDDGSMASVYRERISDERLRAVSEHVRKWLFAMPVPK
jgi:integrase